ncbi:MAG: hypothetical protein HZB68_05155 [Candidatus Aenigmarchaeota archaeon]|nr:hypothetical protein [Candidatus Aenigmarchaeota archaeon]
MVTEEGKRIVKALFYELNVPGSEKYESDVRGITLEKCIRKKCKKGDDEFAGGIWHIENEYSWQHDETATDCFERSAEAYESKGMFSRAADAMGRAANDEKHLREFCSMGTRKAGKKEKELFRRERSYRELSDLYNAYMILKRTKG